MTSDPPTRPENSRRRRLPVVLYAHPIELALGAALLINGVRGLLGDLTPSLTSLPTLALALYLVVSTAGGLGVIVGLVLEWKATERASLFLVAAAFAVLGILVVWINGRDGVSTGIVAILLGAGCFLRALAIRKAAKVVLGILVQQRRDEEGRP